MIGSVGIRPPCAKLPTVHNAKYQAGQEAACSLQAAHGSTDRRDKPKHKAVPSRARAGIPLIYGPQCVETLVMAISKID